MQIPGGDLAPARRRRYGGSYGRRRRQRSVGLLLLLVLAAAGALWFLTREQQVSPVGPAAKPRCQTPLPTPPPTALPAPAQVRVMLLNGTSRNGLAATVRTELEARGFVVVDAANAPAALPGATQVAYGPAGLPAATVVSRHISGAIAVSDPGARPGMVQVTLGSDYRRLASPAEMVAAAPSLTPTPSATPCV